MFGPTFFDSKYAFLCDMCAGVIFFSEVSQDLDVWFVVM